jgi:hypothetical protein
MATMALCTHFFSGSILLFSDCDPFDRDADNISLSNCSWIQRLALLVVRTFVVVVLLLLLIFCSHAIFCCFLTSTAYLDLSDNGIIIEMNVFGSLWFSAELIGGAEWVDQFRSPFLSSGFFLQVNISTIFANSATASSKGLLRSLAAKLLHWLYSVF